MTLFVGDNVLGRDEKCNITVPIKALSKKHACIEVQRDLHLIYDCGSKNRTKKGKGDVKCQYLVGLEMDEGDGDETGSETGSESMLPDANTEEGLDINEKIDEKSGIPKDELLQPNEDYEIIKPNKDDEEAYAADTDSDTDEERPIAAMATVLYSSEDEQETPRQKAPSKLCQTNHRFQITVFTECKECENIKYVSFGDSDTLLAFI
ncbi:Mediator of DNA damage checkpoint protein 1 [Desmophyllum pertusum]|uniref:Mediator of DNA damage checkpoint protein 1 n=1 Tax=Desmophyllum pertusum TaxID=174260 RepID=A0A9W9ZWX9_9CNID|nr:Mediator of DNA damage checkpoint protein 1 [Desmophyllum pertusum]